MIDPILLHFAKYFMVMYHWSARELLDMALRNVGPLHPDYLFIWQRRFHHNERFQALKEEFVNDHGAHF